MAKTPKLGFRIPGPTDPPDGPGGISNLGTDLDDFLASTAWFPGIGNGGVVGTNGGSTGSFMRTGSHMTAKGQIGFGSTASWGNPGSATITSLPLITPMNQALSTGYGRFTPAGGTPIAVQFIPHPNGTDFYIAPVMGAAAGSPAPLGSAFQLGAIPQSSTLTMVLDIVQT
jgi:hypothetical protein